MTNNQKRDIVAPTGPEDAQHGLMVIADWYREQGDTARADLIDKVARLAIPIGRDVTYEIRVWTDAETDIIWSNGPKR